MTTSQCQIRRTSTSTTTNGSSQPDSLDLELDYDMWQGQFEFVGDSNGDSQSTDSLSKSHCDPDELNLHSPYLLQSHNQPILIDEETFLSLHPNDFDETSSSLESSPKDTYLISEAIDNLHLVPDNRVFNNNNDNGLIEDNVKRNPKLINNNLSVEEMNNLRNTLIMQNNEMSKTGGFPVAKSKTNGFATELCDNLNEQLELLQRQVADTQRQVADTQNNVDDRTLRTKTDYAVLQARYHMLEEQHRDLELRYEEKIAEEQKRNKEIIGRVEREAHLQNENCQIRIKTAEIEVNSLRDELQRARSLCDKQTAELEATNEKLQSARDTIVSIQEEVYVAKLNEKKYLDEKVAAEELMLELGKECERLRQESGPAMPNTSVEAIRLEELHAELEDLRTKNKSLEEQNEELQAMVLTRGIEEGRNLLNGTSNSLAHELHEMNENQLQVAYQDKEEENQRLKHYIDTILLNIVENYPQLLEVKSTSSEATNY